MAIKPSYRFGAAQVLLPIDRIKEARNSQLYLSLFIRIPKAHLNVAYDLISNCFPLCVIFISILVVSIVNDEKKLALALRA